jgi:hypothetical protein
MSEELVTAAPPSADEPPEEPGRRTPLARFIVDVYKRRGLVIACAVVSTCVSSLLVLLTERLDTRHGKTQNCECSE